MKKPPCLEGRGVSGRPGFEQFGRVFPPPFREGRGERNRGGRPGFPHSLGIADGVWITVAGQRWTSPAPGAGVTSFAFKPSHPGGQAPGRLCTKDIGMLRVV